MYNILIEYQQNTKIRVAQGITLPYFTNIVPTYIRLAFTNT